MKRALALVTLALSLMLAVGCDKKDDNPVSSTETVVRYTTVNSVKTTPTYFSFDTGAPTDSVGAWDVKLTYTMMVVDPSIPAIKYPFVGLNKARGVLGKTVDGADFSTVKATTITGLQAENDTTGVIGVNCLNYDGTTHLLNPFTNRTFVIQTVSGSRVKFKMVGYYNEAGTSGYMTIDYVKN